MMPPEAPKKAEELLQRYAKERRGQGSDFSLHPATRRLLQGEVARELGSRKSGHSSWLAWLKPRRGRFAMGVGFAAIIMTGVWIFSGGRENKPMQVAVVDAPVREESFAVKSLNDEPQPEPAKQLALATVESQRQKKVGERPVALRPAREVSNQGDSLEKESRSKLTVDSLSLAVNAPAKAEQPAYSNTVYFAGSLTNVAHYAVSLAPGPITWGFFDGGTAVAPGTAPQPTVTAGFSTRGMNLQEDLAARQQAANVGVIGGLAPAGAGGTNFVSLAYKTATFSDGVDASGKRFGSEPLADAKDFGAERERFSKLSELAKAQPTSMPKGGLLGEAYRAGGGRGDAAGVAPISPQSHPVLSAALASAPAAEDKSKAVRLAGEVSQKSAASDLAANESTPRFYRLASTASEKDGTQTRLAFKESARGASAPVLTRFSFEQRGTMVRVVDADGSLYEGAVEEPVMTEFEAPSEATVLVDADQGRIARRKPAGGNETLDRRGREYSFRASGSNVTLRQLVVISGKFTPGTDKPTDSANSIFSGGATTPSATPAAPAAPAPLNRRAFGRADEGLDRAARADTNTALTIEGTVRVGATNLQWFRAVREAR